MKTGSAKNGGGMQFPSSFTKRTPNQGANVTGGCQEHGFPYWQNPDGSRRVEPPAKDGSGTRNYLGTPKGGK